MICNNNERLFHSSFITQLLSSPSIRSVPGISPLGYSLLEYGAGLTFTLHNTHVTTKYLNSLSPQGLDKLVKRIADGSAFEIITSASVLTIGVSSFPQDGEAVGVLKIRDGLSYRCLCQWKDLAHGGSFRLVLYVDEKPLIDTASRTDSIASEFHGTISEKDSVLSLKSDIQMENGKEIRQLMCGRPFRLQPLDNVASLPFVVYFEMFSDL